MPVFLFVFFLLELVQMPKDLFCFSGFGLLAGIPLNLDSNAPFYTGGIISFYLAMKTSELFESGSKPEAFLFAEIPSKYIPGAILVLYSLLTWSFFLPLFGSLFVGAILGTQKDLSSSLTPRKEFAAALERPFLVLLSFVPLYALSPSNLLRNQEEDQRDFPE